MNATSPSATEVNRDSSEDFVGTSRLAALCARGEQIARQREAQAEPVIEHDDRAPHLTAAYYDRELDGEVCPHIRMWDRELVTWLTDFLIADGVSPDDIALANAYDAAHGTRHFEDMLTIAAVKSLAAAHALIDEYEAFTKTDATLAERRRRSRELTERLREPEMRGEGYQPGRSLMWHRVEAIERASGYEPMFLHCTALELKQWAQSGRGWDELRRDLIRAGLLRTRPDYAVRAIERYLYRASMRSRAGGIGQAIHGPPSPDDFGIPTSHLVTATVAPSHAGPLAR